MPAFEGVWSSGQDEDTFVVDEPATGRAIATVAGGGAPEMEAALARAQAALKTGAGYQRESEDNCS